MVISCTCGYSMCTVQLYIVYSKDYSTQMLTNHIVIFLLLKNDIRQVMQLQKYFGDNSLTGKMRKERKCYLSRH